LLVIFAPVQYLVFWFVARQIQDQPGQAELMILGMPAIMPWWFFTVNGPFALIWLICASMFFWGDRLLSKSKKTRIRLASIALGLVCGAFVIYLLAGLPLFDAVVQIPLSMVLLLATWVQFNERRANR
jgi:hypothetical protein